MILIGEGEWCVVWEGPVLVQRVADSLAVMYCIHFDTPGPAPATPSSDSTLCADIWEVRCWYLLLLLR